MNEIFHAADEDGWAIKLFGDNANGVVAEVRRAGGNGGAATTLRLGCLADGDPR